MDEVVGIRLPFLGQVQIDHRRLEAGMTHVFLDHAKVNTCLQQLGGIGVAKRMDGHLAFADTGCPLGFSERAPLRCFWP